MLGVSSQTHWVSTQACTVFCQDESGAHTLGTKKASELVLVTKCSSELELHQYWAFVGKYRFIVQLTTSSKQPLLLLNVCPIFHCHTRETFCFPLCRHTVHISVKVKMN